MAQDRRRQQGGIVSHRCGPTRNFAPPFLVRFFELVIASSTFRIRENCRQQKSFRGNPAGLQKGGAVKPRRAGEQPVVFCLPQGLHQRRCWKRIQPYENPVWRRGENLLHLSLKMPFGLSLKEHLKFTICISCRLAEVLDDLASGTTSRRKTTPAFSLQLSCSQGSKDAASLLRGSRDGSYHPWNTGSCD